MQQALLQPSKSHVMGSESGPPAILHARPADGVSLPCISTTPTSSLVECCWGGWGVHVSTAGRLRAPNQHQTTISCTQSPTIMTEIGNGFAIANPHCGPFRWEGVKLDTIRCLVLRQQHQRPYLETPMQYRVVYQMDRDQ